MLPRSRIPGAVPKRGDQRRRGG